MCDQTPHESGMKRILVLILMKKKNIVKGILFMTLQEKTTGSETFNEDNYKITQSMDGETYHDGYNHSLSYNDLELKTKDRIIQSDVVWE